MERRGHRRELPESAPAPSSPREIVSERSLILGAPAKAGANAGRCRHRRIRARRIGLRRARAHFRTHARARRLRRPTIARAKENSMADLFDNPMGLMGFEFVEFASPDARHAGAAVREARLHARRASTARRTWCCTARATSTSSSTASRRARRRTSPPSTAPRPAAWPSACSDSHQAYARALELGAQPHRDADRPDGAAPAGDQGHRRRAAVPDRPLRGRRVDLRHRLRVPRRRRPPPGRPRPEDRSTT